MTDGITIYEFDGFGYWTGNSKVIWLGDGCPNYWTRSQPDTLPSANQYMKLDGLTWVITELPKPIPLEETQAPPQGDVGVPPEVL